MGIPQLFNLLGESVVGDESSDRHAQRRDGALAQSVVEVSDLAAPKNKKATHNMPPRKLKIVASTTPLAQIPIPQIPKADAVFDAAHQESLAEASVPVVVIDATATEITAAMADVVDAVVLAADGVVEVPVTADVDVPSEVSMDPVPVEVSVEVTPDIPNEVPVEVPAEVPLEIPVEITPDVPLEVATIAVDEAPPPPPSAPYEPRRARRFNINSQYAYTL